MRSDFLESFAEIVRNALEARASHAAELGITVDELDARETLEREQAERTARESDRRKRVVIALRPYVERLGVAVVDAIVSGQLRATPAIDAVRSHCETSEKPLLVLSGGVGTGKTCAALGELAKRHPRDARYLHAADLAKRYEPWSADQQAGVERLDLSVPFIVLDDLGSERGDDPRFHEALGQFVDRRIGPGATRDGELFRRVTIITTNVPPKDIGAKYGERIADRFREHASAVVLTGESMRRSR